MESQLTPNTNAKRADRGLEAPDVEWIRRIVGHRGPLGYQAGDTNLYRYVHNSPTNFTDPSGLAPLDERDWPRWLRDMVGDENATGGRGTIRRIISVNQDFSHARGAGGASVPAHFDVRYEDENGNDRMQRFRRDQAEGGRRAFTDEEHAAMQQNRDTARSQRRQRRTGGGGNTARAINILGAYLTVREACQAAGIGHPDYVTTDREYYFTAPDNSVFYVQEYVWPRSWVSNPRRVFVAGPRAGQTEEITTADVEDHRAEAEARYGRLIPGGWFSSPRFIPGTERRTLPLMEGTRETGYVDEEGVHEYPAPFIRERGI
jgi:hypothetical protein